MWRYLRDDGAGAAEGLALDEALMAGVGRDAASPAPTLRLYSYASHAALVGRFQTLEAEVDLQACRESGTAYSRRPTGGGAIVMGADQLGVALVLPGRATAPRALIEELGQGVVAGLSRLGIQATFGGKNDLLVGGRKIAGLGLYLDPAGALLFHTSLLVDLDIPFMLRVLRIPAAKLADKAVAAVSERVTTVRRELAGAASGITLDEVRDAVAASYAQAHGVRLVAGEPTASEHERAAELVHAKYTHSSWLHEQNAQPDGTGSAVFRSPEGMVRVYVAAQGALAKSVLFTGDFNVVPAGLKQLEAALRWRRLDPTSVAEVVRAARHDHPDDLGWRADDDLVAAVLDAGNRAEERTIAAPVRHEGSCYFPDPASTPSVRSLP